MNKCERQPESGAGTGRLLALVRHNPDECPLHVSAVLQHIRDDGPALVDGMQVGLSARNATSWRKRSQEFGANAEPYAARIEPATHSPPSLPTVPARFPFNIWLRCLLLSALVIAMTQSITAIFSWG